MKTDLEDRTENAPGSRRLGRGVFVLPGIFTVGNIFCGYYAIVAAMSGSYDQAAQAIGIAMVLDMLDGRIARMTHSATAFGLQLDSLADVISFGLAPSILALLWGLSSVNHRLGWIAAFTFTICGAMRLARFNLQAGDFKHFVGLPIPAAGVTIAAIVHFFGEPLSDPIGSACMVATVFFLSLLMVSTIRYTSFKQLALGKKSHLMILVVALLLALIYNYSRPTLLAMATTYSLSGLVMRIFPFLRHKRPSEALSLASPVEHH